ncbi:PD-(D/E)XK nuclease family protein, partial [bacterium]|nr:PD-(D/E)XK nuclease family protein [bacterium]
MIKNIKKILGKLAAFFKSAGTLSAGKINDYIACPRKYKYQYSGAKKSRISSHYLSFANSLQDAVEVMHAGRIAELDDKQVFEILKNCWKGIGYGSSEQEDTFWMAGLRMLMDYVAKNRFFRNRIMAVKENVSGKFAGYLFNVRFSQVSKNPDG